MKSRSSTLSEKAVSSMVSAIEIYNKPDFKYREETFSILATNAWELLLKARVLQLSGNKINSILKYQSRKNKDGRPSKKKYKVKNRSGNYNTVGLFKAYDIIKDDYGENMKDVVRENLEAIVEVRDNSVHFINKDFKLVKKIYEIGTASVKNFIALAESWFGIDFLQYELFLMPIGFVRRVFDSVGLIASREEKNFFQYIKDRENEFKENDVDHKNDNIEAYNFTLNVDVKFSRVRNSSGATEVLVTNDNDAIEVRVAERDILEKFPWSYEILTTRLKKRYCDFKVNTKYHNIRKMLESNDKLCRVRYLNPKTKKSSTKFYSSNILKEFDKYYKK